jgi:polyisoprenyl-teichoic acid--peptidoglycan teichoic acid transferase
VLLTLAMHGWVGVVVTHLDETLRQVFDQAPGAMAPGDVTEGEHAGAEQPDDPINAPEYVWDGEERVNFLLLGTDEAPGRDEILTDVILVVSVDPAANSAVLLSVPRDTGYLPLPDESIYAGGVFPAKANELAATAAADPDLWCPDAPGLSPWGCGIRTVQRSIGLYMGIALHHYALVDMAGFAEIIDAVGGVRLCLPGRLVDPQFGATLSASDGETLILPAGCHTYTGIDALAYARSRQGWIEMPDGSEVQQTDFDRNERQQLVLLALREELADSDTVFELPAVLNAIGRTISTDFPRDQAGDLASLLPLITGPHIDRVVLDVPDFVDAPLEPEVNYLLVPRRDAIREEMSRLFGADELTGWYLATEAPSPDAARREADSARD